MYLAELRRYWRPLAAASIGLGAGYQINAYSSSIFAPRLIDEFGWSKGDYALLGVLPAVSLITMPIVGYVADTIGVRRTVLIGVVASPLLYLGFSAMNGAFAMFFALYLAHVALLGSTTTTVTYTRLIAENFRSARGLALGIMACSPAIFGAILAPTLSTFIDEHGWRNAYLLMAVLTAVGGMIAVLIMPGRSHVAARKTPRAKLTRADFAELFRNRAFQIIMIGMVLCNLTILLSPNLKLILLDKGIGSDTASLMISFYAFGVIGGRVSCGLALDRFPSHIVAVAGLGLPSIGLFLIGSDITNPAVNMAAVFIAGMAFGAEGDIAAFLIMRFFPLKIYSSVYGLVGAATALSVVLGALLMSVTLNWTGGFTMFLWLSAGAIAIGSLLFLMLGRLTPASQAEEPPSDPPKAAAPVAT